MKMISREFVDDAVVDDVCSTRMSSPRASWLSGRIMASETGTITAPLCGLTV